MLETVRGTLSGMGWTAEPPTARGQTRDRWESWQALVDQAAEFEAAGGTLDAFVDDLDRRAAEQHAPVADGVTLATFHAAKGLEWDSVFLCGLQDGTLPITYAETAGPGRGGAPAALRRHDPRPHRPRAVVGAGPPAGRPRLAQAVALPDPAAPAGRAAAAQGRARTKGARMCLECGKPLQTAADKARRRCADCPAPYDEALFDRLREWRTERAREEEIAAFMVFSNATLEEIATRRPQSSASCSRSAAWAARSSPSTARTCSTWSAEPGGRPGHLRDKLAENSREIPIKSIAPYRGASIPCCSKTLRAPRG